MLPILTLATLIFADNTGTLVAESVEPMHPFNQKVERFEAASEFIQGDVMLSVENISDHCDDAASENDVAELLNEVEPEMDASFEGEVARESAKVLNDEMVREEKFEETNPTYEDLQELVATPPITMAEDVEAANPYESLPISVDEKVKAGKILMTMAENSVFKLLFERKRLESWGHDIRHVHPLRFLGTVFTNPRLVHCVRRIRTSGFKWDGFIDGFGERFLEEIKSNNVNAYLEGFAESVGVDLAPVQAYVNNRDFEGLVLYLMKEKSQ